MSEIKDAEISSKSISLPIIMDKRKLTIFIRPIYRGAPTALSFPYSTFHSEFLFFWNFFYGKKEREKEESTYAI